VGREKEMICEVCYTDLDDCPHRIVGYKGLCEDCFKDFKKAKKRK